MTGYTEVMHLIVASNQATTLESSAQQTSANRTGGRTDCLCNLAKTRPLFSKLCHLIAVHDSTRTPQHLPHELKHHPPRRGGQDQVVTKADEGHAVGIEIGERVDEVLQRPPETVNLPAQHRVEVPPL